MVLFNCKLKCQKLGVWFLCGSLVHVHHNVAQLLVDYNLILQLVAPALNLPNLGFVSREFVENDVNSG